MGHLLCHPSPMLAPDAPVPYFTRGKRAWSKRQIRAYMRQHSLHSGDSALTKVSGSIRRPFIGELKEVRSPEDDNAIFTIKRCSVRENQARKNLAATIRYIEQTNNGTAVQERDVPVGDIEIETVFLGLHSWTLYDDNGQLYPITHDNILTYLSPAEFSLLLKEILDMNPAWRGGEAEVKKD